MAQIKHHSSLVGGRRGVGKKGEKFALHNALQIEPFLRAQLIVLKSSCISSQVCARIRLE